jgi:hypothetical protein
VTGGPLTGAWMEARRRCTGGGTSAPSDDGMSARDEGRR